ncbi:hypothetical protein ABFV05_019954 [Capra hircus]
MAFRGDACPTVAGARGAGLRVEVLQRRTCSKNREEQETARIGPGAMASKEEQAVKNHSMEVANQENEKKDGKDQDANKREPMALLSGASEYYVPRGNRRRFRVRQPILHYRWDVTQRLGEPQARMREENMERIGEEIFRSVAVGANPDKEGKDLKYQCRQRRANLNMEKVYRENEGKLENKGNVDNEGKPEDEVQSENAGQSTEKEKLEVERKSEREPEVQNERKPDNERQPAGVDVCRSPYSPGPVSQEQLPIAGEEKCPGSFQDSWSLGSDPNRLREEGGKFPGSLQG